MNTTPIQYAVWTLYGRSLTKKHSGWTAYVRSGGPTRYIGK